MRAISVFALVGLAACEPLVVSVGDGDRGSFDLPQRVTRAPAEPDWLCPQVAFVEPAPEPCGPDDRFVVDGTDHPTLDAAVDAAEDGATVTVCPGRHAASATIVGRTLAIAGTDPDPTVTALEGASDRRITVEEGAVTLADLHVVGGSADLGGGLRARDASIALVGTLWSGHRARSGGAIRVDSSQLRVERSAFSGNAADDEGGAIDAFGSCVEIRRSVFVANDADHSAGAVISHTDRVGDDLGIWSSEFRDNRADSGAGAIEFSNLSRSSGNRVWIFGSTFDGNRAGYAGGAILVDGWKPVDLLLLGSELTGNESGAEGGAISFGGWGRIEATVDDCDFADNRSGDQGGAISGSRHGETELVVLRSRFVKNASRGGAAVALSTWESDVGFVEDTSFIGNRANEGSAILFGLTDGDLDQLDIVNATFRDNTGETKAVPPIRMDAGVLTGFDVDFEDGRVHLQSPCGRRTLGLDSEFVCDRGSWQP